MDGFHLAGYERVNAFQVGEQYYFKFYFEDTDVFSQISQYYAQYEYRFGVPADRFVWV